VPFSHSPSHEGPHSPSSGASGSIAISSSGVLSIGDKKQKFLKVSMFFVAAL